MMLQSANSIVSEQALPPFDGAILICRFLDVVPSPHVTLQVSQLLHSVSWQSLLGHFLGLQSANSIVPGQALPPFDGAISICRFLDVFPPPHVTLQVSGNTCNCWCQLKHTTLSNNT